MDSDRYDIDARTSRRAATKDQNQKEDVRVRLGEISGTAIPIGHFVTLLEAQLGYPMVNDTGLRGAFDLSLRYSLNITPGGDGPSVLSAGGVFVIDSAARPGQN